MTEKRTCSSCHRSGDASKGQRVKRPGVNIWKCQSCVDLMASRVAGTYRKPPPDMRWRWHGSL